MLAVLLALQLPDCEEVYKELKPLLVQLTTDKTAAAATRAAAATSLAGLCFLGGGEMAEVVSTMQVLESVFSASYSKKDGTIPAPSTAPPSPPGPSFSHCSPLEMSFGSPPPRSRPCEACSTPPTSTCASQLERVLPLFSSLPTTTTLSTSQMILRD